MICLNCGEPTAWHSVGATYIHAVTGHCWCYPDRKGYDQPRATIADAGAHDDTQSEAGHD